MRHLSIENRVSWVKGLMIECPLLKALPNCPLKKYRSLSIKEKFKLVDEMSGDQIDTIVEYHQRCLHTRESPSVDNSL